MEDFGQKSAFWVKYSVYWARGAQFAITRQNDAFVAKIVNTRLTNIFMAIFAPGERLPTSATLFRSLDNHQEIQLLKLGLAISILVIRTCLALVEYIKSSSLEGQDKDIAAS